MSQVDHSMALTPPSRLNVGARIGALIAGIGILFLYIALLSSNQLIATYDTSTSLTAGCGPLNCCVTTIAILTTVGVFLVYSPIINS